MAKFIDLSGQKIGDILILYRSTQPGMPIKYMCKCICGNEFEARGNDIKLGKTKSCGCLRSKTARYKDFVDLTGKVFGKLTVINEVTNINKNGIYWHCKCECGNELDVLGSALKSGNTQSCGCSRKNNFTFSKNLIGLKFGKLTVIDKTEERINDNIVWNCKCDCGNYKKVYTNLLTQGKVKSCGCLISYGEEIIKDILILNKIPFEQQKTFETCRFPDTNALAKFDFFIDNKYLVEFDGKQHFGLGGWGEDFEKIKARDEYKNNWCKENNMVLIRIPYNEIEKINLDKLLLKENI